MNTRQSNCLVWNYFERHPAIKIAKCNFCKKPLSFKTTVTNLKQHLRIKHNEEYQDFIARSSQFLQPDDDKGPRVSQELMKHASEIRSYFEQEVGGGHRCVICRASRTSNLSDLMEHLKEKHPKLLAEIEQDSDSASDNDDHSEKTYTEVVYLEDEVKNFNRKSEPITYKNNASKRQKTEKTQRNASFYEEMPVKLQSSQSPEDEELESFVKYISCLLKQVPKDIFGKLQMDIVNLIMNAKLNSNATQNNVVFENIIQNVSNIDNMSMLIASERKEQDIGKSVPEYKVLSQNNVPVTSAVTGTYVTTLNCGEKSSAINDDC